MTLLPEAIVVHAAPGRTRIRLSGEKGDQTFFNRLVPALAGFPGVEGVAVNSRVGSLLIRHRCPPEEIWRRAAQENLFQVAARTDSAEGGSVKKEAVLDQVRQKLTQFDQQVRSQSHGRLDISGLAFFSLAGLALYDVAKGNIRRPPWYAALWYAFDIAYKAGRKQES